MCLKHTKKLLSGELDILILFLPLETNFTKRLYNSRGTINVNNIDINNKQKPRQLKSMWNDNYSIWSEFDQEVHLHKQYIE